jgi:hypothetical protein
MQKKRDERYGLTRTESKCSGHSEDERGCTFECQMHDRRERVARATYAAPARI